MPVVIHVFTCVMRSIRAAAKKANIEELETTNEEIQTSNEELKATLESPS